MTPLILRQCQALNAIHLHRLHGDHMCHFQLVRDPEQNIVMMFRHAGGGQSGPGRVSRRELEL